MEYSLTVERLRMQAVLQSIDGGNGPGTIELRDANRVMLAKLVMTRPSFYLVGSSLELAAPTTGYVTVAGVATLGTITDASGNLVIDNMTVGIDSPATPEHDFEIVLDTNQLDIGKQVTIVSATIEHG